jgi:serine/threonine protein phosphatase PrpC
VSVKLQAFNIKSTGVIMYLLTYGTATTTGQGRSTNHDVVFASNGLFIVADGQQAAQLVIETISQYLQTQPLTDAKSILNTLTQAYTKATEVLQQQGFEATASATTVYISDGTAYIAHVGNTRAYAVNKYTLDLLTTDHVMEEKTLEYGMDFAGDVFDPVLHRAIGLVGEVPDTLTHPLKVGTGILLLSDGVYRAGAQLLEFDDVEQVRLPLDDKAILKIVQQSADAQTACDALITAAQYHGSNDDLSAVFIQANFLMDKKEE